MWAPPIWNTRPLRAKNEEAGIVIVWIGLLAGVLIGFLVPYEFPGTFTPYIAVAILAAFDSLFGGVNAKIKGRFSLPIFLSGFFGNAAIAAVLTYAGEKLGVNLSIAAVVVFGTRLFQNFAEIRRNLLTNRRKRGIIEDKNVPGAEDPAQGADDQAESSF